MKVLVGVKRVIDYAVKVRVKPDKTGVETKSVKHSINPFCEIAVEEAVKLKEMGVVEKVTALSIGDKTTQEILRTAMAIGADESIQVLTDKRLDTQLSSLAVMNIFKHFVEKEKYDIVILGKQSIDTDFNHTAQMLSGALNWPLITFASEFASSLGDNKKPPFLITKEVDTGLQKLEVNTPFVLSCDLRLNTPRYTTLKNITAAKKKKIHSYNIEDCLKESENGVKILSVENPPSKQAGVKVADVDELINKLKNEAKVI